MTPSGLKNQLQNLLVRVGIYERVKASRIYDLYWSIADRQVIGDRQREIDFYRHLLEGFQEGDLIFDIGANQGYKADIFMRLQARVVAVEPDETSQQALQRRFLKYRLKKKPLIIIPKAVSDRNSTETMWIDTPGGAKNTLNRKWADTLKDDQKRFGQNLSFGRSTKVETLSMAQLVSEYGSPFFVKIDVEGHELNVLRGMHCPVPYLSFEVNLPEFQQEGLECVEVLHKLAPDGRFNYTPDCRRGLALDGWISKEEISTVLSSCADESIEIFWKTPLEYSR